MSAKSLPEDVMLCNFWSRAVAIAHLGKADEALEFVREVALLEGKLHLSIVSGVREREARVAASGFVGRPMHAKYPGRCAVCAGGFGAGSGILYDAERRRTAHDGCGEPDA